MKRHMVKKKKKTSSWINQSKSKRFISMINKKHGLQNSLIIYQIFKLFDENGAKLEHLGLKIAIFFKWLIWETKFYIYLSNLSLMWRDLSLNWRCCERQERREKGILRAAHPHTPFSGACPPRLLEISLMRLFHYSTVRSLKTQF